jgi:hypothetical protein
MQLMLDYTLSAEELATLRQAHSKMTEKRLVQRHELIVG